MKIIILKSANLDSFSGFLKINDKFDRKMNIKKQDKNHDQELTENVTQVGTFGIYIGCFGISEYL